MSAQPRDQNGNGGAGQHPSAADLVNLAREQLGQKKTQRILDHCKRCPACAEALLDAISRQPIERERFKLSKWNWISIAVLIAAVIALFGLLLWLLAAGSRVPQEPEAPGLAAETVYSEQPAGWYEDLFTRLLVAPAGDSMLRIDAHGVRLLALPGGGDLRPRLWLDFDGIMAATWDGNGALARYANKRRDLGWFVQQGEEMLSTSLPLDSTPWWAPGNRDVAWTRPPATHINLGYPPRHRSFAVGGRVLGMAWAPSGEEVYALAMDEQGDSSLVRVRRALTRVQVLRAGLDASPLPNSLAVSPDGDLIFVALASDGPVDPESRHDPGADRDLDIYAVGTRSGEIRRVIAAPGDDFWPWLAGGALYWTHNEQRASVVLFAVGAAASPLIVAGHEVDGVDAQLPRWGPAGGRLAYTRGAWRLADWGLPFDAMVTTVSAAGSAAAPAPLVAGYHQDLTPVWSPDGRWLAYHSRRSQAPVPHYAGAGVADDIFVRPADDPGAPEVRVSEQGWEVGGPSWLADGRLLFDSWDREGLPGISRPLLVEIDAGTGRAVDVWPLPLPDGIDGPVSAVGTPRAGEVLLIERIDAGSQALWLARLDGEEAERLLGFESPTAAGADWMPDGRSLVYSALADDRLQLFEVSRAGGTPRRITSGAASYLHPSVSPDGRWIAATKLDQRKELRKIALADLR